MLITGSANVIGLLGCADNIEPGPGGYHSSPPAACWGGSARSLQVPGPQNSGLARLQVDVATKLCCRSSWVTGQLPWGRTPFWGAQFLACALSDSGPDLGVQGGPQGLRSTEQLYASLKQDTHPLDF